MENLKNQRDQIVTSIRDTESVLSDQQKHGYDIAVDHPLRVKLESLRSQLNSIEDQTGA